MGKRHGNSTHVTRCTIIESVSSDSTYFKCDGNILVAGSQGVLNIEDYEIRLKI